MSIEAPTSASFGVETYARVVVVVISVAQSIFYYHQRTKGRCGWEKLYTTVAESITYTIVAALGSAAVVTISGRPWMWPRYAGWLSTCPVLLIDVSMVPMPSARRPGLAMTSILAQQLMVLLGMTSIFYNNIYLRTSIFLAAVAFGLFVFKIVAETFVRAWNSFPEKEPQMRTWLLVSALLFFSGWVAFPVLFIVGKEGFGSMPSDTGALLHVVADLVAKNSYSYASWYLRWVIIREYLDRSAKEAAELENRKAKAIKDAEAGLSIEASPSGTDVGAAGMSAVVAALAAEERELQRPIDVTDVIHAANDITSPALQEVFAALVDTACLTTPAVLSSILPAALDRAESVKIRVVIVDSSPTRQAAAARRAKATDAAKSLGIVVRFAFRPRDVARLRAAQGGKGFHAVVLTDDALFSACADASLDERTRGQALGAGKRASGGVTSSGGQAHAPFSASFARRQEGGDRGALLAKPSFGLSVDAIPVSETEVSSDSGYEVGHHTGVDDLSEDDGHRGTRLGRMGSALALHADEEEPVGRGPVSALQAIRDMASDKDDAIMVVIGAGKAHGAGGSSSAGSRVSLYDVGADTIISAMGHVREWNEAMDWAGDVAEERVTTPTDDEGAHRDDQRPERIQHGWRPQAATDSEDEDYDAEQRPRRRGGRGGRRRSRSGGDDRSDSDAHGYRPGRGGRRRRSSGNRYSSGDDDRSSEDDGGRQFEAYSDDDRASSASRPRHGGKDALQINDDTGATQILAEAVRAALDASTRAVLPQSLARLVSGVAKSADAIVSERVQARQEADDRRSADGLMLGGTEAMGMAIFDSGVDLVPRSELDSDPNPDSVVEAAPQGAQVKPMYAAGAAMPGTGFAPGPPLTKPGTTVAVKAAGAGARRSASPGVRGGMATPRNRVAFPPNQAATASVASTPTGSAGHAPPPARGMRVARGGRRGSMDNMADAIGRAFEP